MFSGNVYLDGVLDVLSNPNTDMAAPITLDLNTICRKSLFGLYDDDTSLVTFLRFMIARSANIVQLSTDDFPLKNLE